MCYIKDIYSRVGSIYMADARCGYFEHRLEMTNKSTDIISYISTGV